MFKIMIFGGTTEGRELAEFCAEKGIFADVSVATDYGAELLVKSDTVKILTGKLDFEHINELLLKNHYSMVIDATHPYAVLATKNISHACNVTQTAYFRLLRENNPITSGIVAENIDEVVELLNRNEKIILSTLGSKELPKISSIKKCFERLWVRILPAEGIVEYCKSFGIDENKIIPGKAPFSVEENIEHIRLSNAEILVTKESGKTGGYPQKVMAANECKIQCLTVKRPHENGFSAEDIRKIIIEKSGDCI